MTINLIIEQHDQFTAKVRGVDFTVDLDQLPANSLAKVFEYGMQRILNDSAANAKTDEEATAMAQKRWDNLVSGVLRASPNREGNPIKAEAKRIALAKVAQAPKFRAWLAENGLKASDKLAKAKQVEMADTLAQRDDILALAKANVDAAKGLDIDIDI